MLSKFFGSRPKSSSGNRPASSASLVRSEDAKHGKTAMKNANRELYEFEQPTQELGMTDLIKNHKTGDRFLYAAVTASQDEEEPSRLRRLIQHRPKLNRSEIPIGDLPTIALYKETEEFKLSTVLSAKQSKGKNPDKTYINISEVLIVYGSVISSDSAFSKVRVCIVDDRLVGNKIAKAYVANTNVISKATMSLSYSFPRDEIDKISLTLSREASFLEEGVQWGAVNVRIQVTETTFPIQLSNTAVRAINTIPQSMLEERDVDPDLIDISMMESNRKMLRDKYLDGDLADETDPIKNKTEVTKYAKSSIQGPRGKKMDKHMPEEWNFINGTRTGIDEGLNSVDPSEDGDDDFVGRPPTPPLKSALKRTKGEIDENERITEVEEEDEVKAPIINTNRREVKIQDPNVFFT